MTFTSLGYQLRVDISQIEVSTTVERNKFLLNPTIEIQLSVDRAVWRGYRDANVERALFSDAPLDIDEHPNGLDVFQLGVTSDIASQLQGFHGCLIELAVLSNDADRLISLHAINLRHRPAGIGRWEVLGIDVCNDWHLSAVANIDVGANWQDIRNIYGSRTNSWGLFATVEDALAYSEKFNEIVPEHAPFTPCRLSRFISN